MKIVRRTIKLEAPAGQVFDLLTRSSTLVFVAGKLIRHAEEELPEFWHTGKKFNLKPKVFVIFPATDLFVEFTKIDALNMIITTEETGKDIVKWNHTMRLKPLSENECEYTDEIELVAPFHIYLFAQIFYWYRHRRWPKLLRKVQSR